jgi:hypothetical protein
MTALELMKEAKALYADDDINIDIPDTEEEAEELLSRADEGVWVALDKEEEVT